jgi:hypothetical protein
MTFAKCFLNHFCSCICGCSIMPVTTAQALALNPISHKEPEHRAQDSHAVQNSADCVPVLCQKHKGHGF